MKIIYAIQGTGNGHLARAREIVPILQKKAKVDVLVSGTQGDIQLPFPVRYQLKGLSFIFGKRGGVSVWETFRQLNSRQFLSDMASLPLQQYDLVINDFEPVTAWACKRRGVPCVGLSHQAGVIAPQAPLPSHRDLLGYFILHNYAPAATQYGFHFERYSEKVFTPVIRAEIRRQAPENMGHYTVYLPAWSDDHMVRLFEQIPEVKWEIFSKHTRAAYQKGHIHVRPVQNEAFIKSMVTSEGVLCGAGFETPAEALFMGKKLMAIPMKGQYEQHCNAAGLQQMGVPIVQDLSLKNLEIFRNWVLQGAVVPVDYPDETESILDRVLEPYQQMLV
jgi:uncharacterized protein (TIGR00661 family)